MSFILKWLRPETSARIGLRPHRTVEMDVDYPAAYDLALRAIEETLGANVYVDDRAGKLIEAGFGLINNERVRVTFEIAGESRTNAHVEAMFRAGVAVPEKSAAVDALAAALSRPMDA